MKSIFNKRKNSEKDFIHYNPEEIKVMKDIAAILQNVESLCGIYLVIGNIGKSFSELKEDILKKYECMPEGKDKVFITPWIDQINKSFIYSEISGDVMPKKEFLTAIEKIYDTAKIHGKGFLTAVKKSEFIDDVIDACRNEKSNAKEKVTMTKIFDYYIFAEHEKDAYNDSEIYNSLRKKSIDAYNSILSQECQGIILKYVDKEFLKVK